MQSLADGLGGVEALVPLDPESLLAAAGETLDGLGEWAEAFTTFIWALRSEGDLHAAGAVLTRAEIVRHLRNRRAVDEAHAADPSLAADPVVAPLVITGLARSGTSILHELLAQDPRHRVPQEWEVFYSTPAPDAATYDSDPRIAIADGNRRLWDDLTPEYRAMHANGAQLPVECIFLMADTFVSDQWSGCLPVPGYATWLRRQDMRRPLRHHRRVLQLLQSRHRLDRWVLKAPSHLAWLPALFDVYPDAWVVHTHRDPLKSVPSTISLMATLQWMRSNHTLVDALAPGIAHSFAAMLDHVRRQRAEGTIPDERIIDVRYQDLMSDPIGTLRGVYERIGADFPEAVGERVLAYLAAKPKGAHGAHEYSLAEFGLDTAELRQRYAGYQAAYDVPDEG
jgi:hypothetical protein